MDNQCCAGSLAVSTKWRSVSIQQHWGLNLQLLPWAQHHTKKTQLRTELLMGQQKYWRRQYSQSVYLIAIWTMNTSERDIWIKHKYQTVFFYRVCNVKYFCFYVSQSLTRQGCAFCRTMGFVCSSYMQVQTSKTDIFHLSHQSVSSRDREHHY